MHSAFDTVTIYHDFSRQAWGIPREDGKVAVVSQEFLDTDLDQLYVVLRNFHKVTIPRNTLDLMRNNGNDTRPKWIIPIPTAPKYFWEK